MIRFKARIAVTSIGRALLVLGLLGAATIGGAQPAPPTPPEAPRKVFLDSVVPLPAQDGLTPQGLLVHKSDAKQKEEKLDVLFSVAIPKEVQEKLEARVAKGEVLTPTELERDFGANQADVDKLVAWLKDQKIDVTGISKDRTSVYTRATTTQYGKSLQVQMVRVSKNGHEYNAARNAPSLPADVGASVHAIIGLQPFRQAHKNARPQLPTKGNRASVAALTAEDEIRVTAAAANANPTPNIQNAPPYLVKEILKAYNANGLNVSGAGQEIAILIDMFPKPSDLQKFWQRNQLNVPASSVKRVNVKGGPTPPREGEETLDVEWSLGIAPGATVRVYASGSLMFVDLDRALDAIIDDLPSHPKMRQLSISLGLGEAFMGGPSGEIAIEHQKFLRLAAAGVNVFVSSGDAGSNPDETGHGSGGPLNAEYQSSDSFVIAIGGTTLTLDPAGAVSSERAWSSSGGGISQFFDRPVWQVGLGVPAGTKRLVPDVSLAADPQAGAFIVFNGEEAQIGGTSWSAPAWAGFCALMNEAREKAHKPQLPYLNTVIYPLINTPAFRDIIEGNNGAYDAAAGYDMITGLGVPDMAELIKAVTK